jgi:hypothetical protein
MVCQVFTLKNKALSLNKFFAVQQYTEPSGILGKDITPDSGVVMESRQPSRVSTYYLPRELNRALHAESNRIMVGRIWFLNC